MKNRLFGMMVFAAGITLVLAFSACGGGGYVGGGGNATGEPALTANIAIIPGMDVTVGTGLTALYMGTEQVAYQWKRDGNIVGSGSTYTPDEPGIYTVTVSAEGFKSKTSGYIVVNADLRPDLSGAITISPSGGPIGIGMLLTAQYNGFEAVAYQWKRGGYTAGTGNTYTPDEAGSYTVIVSATGFKSKTSDPVIVTADPVIVINSQPVSRTFTEGKISGNHLNVGATVYGGATAAYQWYSNTSDSNSGGTPTGDGASYFAIPPSLTEGTYYYFCEVSAAGAVSARSDVAAVTIRPVPTGTVDRISFTGFPQSWNQDYCTFTLYSGGTGIGGGYPVYSGMVATGDTMFRWGSATNCLLFTSNASNGVSVSLPAADSYYVVVINTTISGRKWGSRKKVEIGYPIDWADADFWAY